MTKIADDKELKTDVADKPKRSAKRKKILAGAKEIGDKSSLVPTKVKKDISYDESGDLDPALPRSSIFTEDADPFQALTPNSKRTKQETEEEYDPSQAFRKNPNRIQPEGTTTAKRASPKRDPKTGRFISNKASPVDIQQASITNSVQPTESVEQKSSELAPAPTRLATSATKGETADEKADRIKMAEDDLEIQEKQLERLDEIKDLLKKGSDENDDSGKGGGFLDQLKEKFGALLIAGTLLKSVAGLLFGGAGKIISAVLGIGPLLMKAVEPILKAIGLKSLLPGAKDTPNIDIDGKNKQSTLPDRKNKPSVSDLPDIQEKNKTGGNTYNRTDKPQQKPSYKPSSTPKPASSGGFWNKVKSVGGSVIQHVPKALGALPGMLTGAASAAPLAVSAGAVIAAGAAGYAVGTALNYGMNAATSAISGGKYESVGEALADKLVSNKVDYEGTNKILKKAADRGGILFAMEEGNLKDQGIQIPKDFKVVSNDYREAWNKNEVTEDEMKKLKDAGFVIPSRMKVKGGSTNNTTPTASPTVETKKEETPTTSSQPATASAPTQPTTAKPVDKAAAMEKEMDEKSSPKQSAAAQQFSKMSVKERTDMIEKLKKDGKLGVFLQTLSGDKEATAALVKGVDAKVLETIDKEEKTITPTAAPPQPVDSKLDKERFGASTTVDGQTKVYDKQTKEWISKDDAVKISSQPKPATQQQVASPVTPPEQSRVSEKMQSVSEGSDQSKSLDSKAAVAVNNGGNSTTNVTNINNSGGSGGVRPTASPPPSGMDLLQAKVIK